MKSKLPFFLLFFFDKVVELFWSPTLCQLSARLIFTRNSVHTLWKRLSSILDKTLGREGWLLVSSRPIKWWYPTFAFLYQELLVFWKKFFKSGASYSRFGLILADFCPKVLRVFSGHLGALEGHNLKLSGVNQWRAPLLTTPHMFCCVAAVTAHNTTQATK